MQYRIVIDSRGVEWFEEYQSYESALRAAEYYINDRLCHVELHHPTGEVEDI